MFKSSSAVAIAFAAQVFFSSNYAAAQSASASIQVTVAQPQPVAAGANFDYVVNVSNEGPADAANPTLTFPLPSGVSFQSDAVPAGWSCNSIAPGTLAPTVTCTAATLPPGSASFTITASTAPTASGTFSTTVTVSSTTPDPNDNDNSAEIDVTVTTQSDFSMTLGAAPNPVNAGTNLTWTMTVTNNGPSTGMNAVASLPLPPSTTFVSVAAPAGWSCTTPSAGANGTVSCSLTTTMNPAAAATFTVVSQVSSSVAAGTTVSGTATVSSPDDSAPANDSATASVQSAVLFDLGITKTRPPSLVLPGGPLQYTIVVSNFGPSDAPGVTMTDVLPAPLRFTSIAAPAGWSCTTPSAGANGTVTCSMTSMVAATAATFTLNVVVDPATTAGTPINNTASVSSSSPDSNSSNNSATASAVVGTPPNVFVSKSINGAVHPEGAVVTYTIVLTNSGSIAQGDNPGNELTDVLPSSLTLLSANATSGTAVANLGTNTVAWNGTIAGGGSVTITIQASVKSGTAGTTISNSATVSFDSDANGTNDTTRPSDDPATSAPSDPTSFVVAGVVPALSTWLVALLAAALALIALLMIRK
ncbi:MAG TPA: hypothetical protein VNN08_01760 [Thermoanaerobaculia bacterium]|nr:hypothetical protein [Thermoanaerobaculia bacterium]